MRSFFRSANLSARLLSRIAPREAIGVLRSAANEGVPPKIRSAYGVQQRTVWYTCQIRTTETGDAPEEKYHFQTETRQVLDIVTHSLYTDREVFLRELVSNASDALEKARHLSLTDQGVDSGHPLEIKIELDPSGKKLTIYDSGIGMTKEELLSHLGTIARSGTKAYLKTLQEKGERAAEGVDGSGIIGKFGVGFYSAFMVADHVEVFTRSALPNSEGLCWRSAGDGSFTISAAEAAERGTKVVLHLKADATSFANKEEVTKIVKKYSNFVHYPILVDEERLNNVQALWTRPPKEVTDEEHAEFFRYVSGGSGEPHYKLHVVMDAPLSIKAALYVPEMNMEKFGFGSREETRVSLYSRRVLISQKAAQSALLPAYLRFLTGAVDCEDVPLNLSREAAQDSALVARLAKVLTLRVIKFIASMAKEDPEKYLHFFSEFGSMIKEGLCFENDRTDKLKLAPLLRCESSKGEGGAAISLDEYIARCPEDQKHIYYICAPSREMAKNSPYMEAFRASDTEVLFFYSSIDEFVMQHLSEYKDKRVMNAESEACVVPVGEKATDLEKDGAGDAEKKDKEEVAEGAALSEQATAELCDWMKKTALAGKVGEVRASKRLVDSPAVLVGHQSSAMRKVQQAHMQMSGGHQELDLNMGPIGNLEINPNHEIMRQLSAAMANEDERTRQLARSVAEQVFDNAQMAAGILDDPRSMLRRLNSIMTAAISSNKP